MVTFLYSATASADGYIAGPQGDMSWLLPFLDEEPDPVIAGAMRRITAMLMGRRTFEGSDPHADDPEKEGAFEGQWEGPQVVLIAEQGYGRTTTSQLCSQAGISLGTLYHYFPGKKQIFLAVLTQDQQDTATLLNELLDAEHPDAVAAWISALINALYLEAAMNPTFDAATQLPLLMRTVRGFLRSPDM